MTSNSWIGWGGSIHNRRLAASDATITQRNVGSILKTCEYRYEPAGVSASPLVLNVTAYYPTWTGLLVALDYKSCDVLWTSNITKMILDFAPRTEVQVGSGVNPVSRTSPVTDGSRLYVGTLAHALVLAIDRDTGELISHVQIDDHPVALITQSPTWHDGQLLVGTSSFEIITATHPGYSCCDHVGSMNSVIFEKGFLKLRWKTMMIVQPEGLTGDPFSGASVWGSSPVVDMARDVVYIATGNTHSIPDETGACQLVQNETGIVFPDPCLPPEVYQESVLALDLATGDIKWARQLGVLDAFNLACMLVPVGAECPPVPGLDSDFGMGPTLITGDGAKTPDGKDLIVIGQKNGNLYGISPETGQVLWLTEASPPGLEGGLSWGIAADDTAVYFTAINNARTPYTAADGQIIHNSAFGAAALIDGKIMWQDKATGGILREDKLEDFFHGGIAVAQGYLMFGTGYWSGLQPPFAGSFQVWKATSCGK
ncbi:pyrrolo-quinoline quinone [Colletotrichum plurivorum]|uniref:Pyrrolo-quinoline quinone n=1 Tax=Colletotrichum plurivorum TaxID=2175906 RepID=A0A8H6KVY9_9PEZI|nr:pyrrolo-quinoline quinone [Colletotrichum plurivorum]